VAFQPLGAGGAAASLLFKNLTSAREAMQEVLRKRGDLLTNVPACQ